MNSLIASLAFLSVIVVTGGGGGAPPPSYEVVLVDGLTETDGSWRDEINNNADIAKIDDTWQGTYDDEIVCSDEAWSSFPATATLDFDTPTSTPTSTTNTQTIRVVRTKVNRSCIESAVKPDPDNLIIKVYDGSSLVTLEPGISCSSTADVESVYFFTYNGGATGSEVYVQWISAANGEGTNTNIRTCGIEALQWYAETN